MNMVGWRMYLLCVIFLKPVGSVQYVVVCMLAFNRLNTLTSTNQPSETFLVKNL